MQAGAEHIVGFMDLGTNAARLLLVRITPNHSYTVITQQKEFVRLGEGEFSENTLQPAAMDRAVLVCRKFADLARSFGAEEIIAVATSAVRDATNQREFIQRLNEEARLDVRVISGREEARLIYLGVASGVHLGAKNAVFIDIGGGSTEVIVGTQREYHELDSLKLGTIRLTAQFHPGETGPVSPECYAAMQRHVRSTAVRMLQRLSPKIAHLAFGSSGTIENLASIAARTIHKRQPLRHESLSAQDLRQVVVQLCALSVEERRKVPGINPERADIIIAGAAILETLLRELRLPNIRISNRGLRDGLLVEYLARPEFSKSAMRDLSVRAQSVLRLGRICQFDERHAAHVTRLAMDLFDSARDCKLHNLGEWERELLCWAAQLHDIGSFLAYTNHHAHSYYFIRNANLLGFDQTELAIIATTAFFHRKVFPRKRHPEFAVLDTRSQQIVRILCVLLRIAESLDRSHAGLVEHADFRVEDNKYLRLEIHGHDCPLEFWGVQAHQGAVKKAFDRKLIVADGGDEPQG